VHKRTIRHNKNTLITVLNRNATIYTLNVKEWDNSKIYISSDPILSVCLLIMFDTLFLRTSLQWNTSLHFTTLHPTTLHYTYRHFTSSHLHFTSLSFGLTHSHFLSFCICNHLVTWSGFCRFVCMIRPILVNACFRSLESTELSFEEFSLNEASLCGPLTMYFLKL
jgi:hypothetical protein